MTITDEEAVTLARDEAAVTLARDTVTLLIDAIALLRDIAARLEATAEWADVELAGGEPPKEIARQMVIAGRQTARFARGQAVTP